MNTQFIAGLAARTKQVITSAIQNRIDTLDQRYYDGLIDVMKYLVGLSILPTKVKSKSVESKKIERKISKTKCRNMKMSKYKSVEG